MTGTLREGPYYGRDGIDGAVVLKQRPESLTYSVYEAIKEAIIDGRLPAKTRVTEAGLAKQLGVSKTPVREVILRLKEIGLIEADGPKIGRIVSPSFTRMRDAYEVREALEATSSRAAAERGDRTLLVAAKQKADATLAAVNVGDMTGYQLADQEFHSIIAKASGNERLERLVGDANVLVTVLRQRDTPEMGASLSCAYSHVSIAEALLLGRAEDAFQLMAEHVREVRDAVLAPFASERPAERAETSDGSGRFRT